MNNPAVSSGVSPDVSLPDKSGQAGILLKQNIGNPFIDSRQKISGMTKRGKPRGIKPIFENKKAPAESRGLLGLLHFCTANFYPRLQLRTQHLQPFLLPKLLLLRCLPESVRRHPAELVPHPVVPAEDQPAHKASAQSHSRYC